MGKKLLIVESPTKARVFKKGKYLSSDFYVEASKGHIIDLPERNFGIDVENNFEPKYTIIKGKEKELEKLKKLAMKCDEVYLAPDPDREGEAIAWHLKNYLKEIKDDLIFYRVRYNEINKKAVNFAIENPSKIDDDRVDAQQARRVLDRIVGYRLSPVLWKWLKRGMSVGRVQTVGLELVCLKELEINKFKSKKYYNLFVKGTVNSGALEAKLNYIDNKQIPKIEKNIRGVLDKAIIEKAEKVVAEKSLLIEDVSNKDSKTSASPPFITSTLQQAASSRHGFSPSKTMKIAQELYEGVELENGAIGLITYMRTDSFNVAKDALENCRNLILNNYGESYLPKKALVYRKKSNAQEAHEAVRPVNVNLVPGKIAKYLSNDQYKLYSLIWKRFVASQMTSAINENLTVKLVNEDKKYKFVAKFTKEKFDGFRKVYGDGKSDYIKSFPKISKGEKFLINNTDIVEKSTKPPARYSEATLVKALEENGVGRPSTYATIIKTLKSRKYVEVQLKRLVPTEDGMAVYNWVMEHAADLFKIEFTANMEKKLDKIESGNLEWKSMVKVYYDEVEKFVDAAKPPQGNVEDTEKLIKVFSNFEGWNEPKKVGRRTYDDKKFVKSVIKTFETKGAVTQKQLNAFIKIFTKYKEDLDAKIELSSVVSENSGDKKGKIVDDKDLVQFAEMIRLLNEQDNFNDGEKDIVLSLKEQLETNNKLSYKQKELVKRVFIRVFSDSDKIEEYVEKFGLDKKTIESISQSANIISKLCNVTDWTITKTKNGKERNEKDFFESLKSQYEKSGVLSTKQFYYLNRMYKKYFKDE